MSAPNPPSSTADYLTTEAIAAELGLHPQTVMRYFREGGLPGRKVGRTWRTTRAALDQWLTGGNGPTAGGDTHIYPPLETK